MIIIALAIAIAYVLVWPSESWAAIVTAGLMIMGTTISWGTIAYAAATTALGVYSTYRTRRAQKEMQNRLLTNSGGGFASSPMYAYSGIGTVWDVMGKPIHVVLGTHGTGGMCVQSYTKRIGATDYWYGLFAISMGEVSDIRNVKLNGENIANFSGASYQIRKGTHDQTAIDWFRDINTQYTQSGKRVLSTSQTTYTVAAACDKLRVRFNMPHGFGIVFSQTYELDNSNGQTVYGGYPFPHHLSIVTITSSGMTTVTADPFTYVSGNFSPVNFEIELTGPFAQGQVLYFSKPATWPAGGDHDSESYNNTGAPGTVTIYDYIEIAHVIETTFGTGEGYTYPDVALLGVCCPATNTLTSEPETTCVCDGVLCTLPGYLDTPTFTKNPAPQLYTCLTNTLWGAGKYYKAENFEEWVTAANHFDVMISDGAGGTEKRMEINFVMDAQYGVRELRELFGKLTGSRIFRIRGKYRWFLDIPQTVPAMLFSDGNYVQGSLSWSSSTADTMYESIAVKIKDELNDYEDLVIEIPYTTGSAEKLPQLTTDLYGITKLSRATHMGIRLLREARLRDGTATLKGMLDSIACEPGNLVNVGDKEQGQISTGNIVGYGNDYLVLPEPVTFEAGSNYDVLVMLKSGAVGTLHVQMTGAAPQNMSGVTSEIVYITTTFSAIGSTPRDHSPYSLGLNTNAKEDYIVHSIKRTGVNDIEVSMVPYADIWSGAESAPVADIESVVAWSGDSTPAHITGLTLTEQLTTAASGEVISNILVSFTPPADSPGWAKARIYINQGYDDQPVVGYQYYGDSTGQTIIPNVQSGVTIGIIAQSVSSTGLLASYADAPEETIEPVGLAGTPEDVVGLIALQQGSSVLLQWTDSDNAVTRKYEVRRGLTWGGSAVVYTGDPNEFRDWNVTNDTYRYWVAGVSSTGSYSANKTSTTVTVQNIPNANVVFEDSEYDDDWDGTLYNMVKVSDGMGGYYLQSSRTEYAAADNMASAGTSNASNYTSENPHGNAFDNSYDTYWDAGSTSAQLYMLFPTAEIITHIKLCTKNEGGETLVKDFKVYGGTSIDGAEWTEIYSGQCANLSDKTIQSFDIGNSTGYLCYKLDVINTWDALHQYNSVKLYEMELYGYPYTATYTTLPYALGRVDSAYFWLLEDADWKVVNGTWADYYPSGSTWLDAFDNANEPWTEMETSGTYTLQQRFSADGVTWADWTTYSYGTYTAGYVQYLITATITSPTMSLTVRDLQTMIDVEDVIVRINTLNIGAGGTAITYANYTDTQGRTAQFYSAPVVQVQMLNASKSLAPVVTDNTTTGCTITAYNASDAVESGIACVTIQGY